MKFSVWLPAVLKRWLFGKGGKHYCIECLTLREVLKMWLFS